MAQDTAPPLERAFWLYAALPRGAALVAVWCLGLAGPLPQLLLGGLLLCDLLLFVWQARLFQRSADDHIRTHGAMAAVWGGQLALLFAASTAASLWWGVFLNAGQTERPELFTEQMDRLHAAAYRLESPDGGREVHFRGIITYGLTKRLTAFLKNTPQAAVLVLSSPGGHIYEARGAAQVVLAHGLATRVEAECASACTLIFAAGSTRTMARGARLGFHGYGVESGAGLPNVDLAAEQEKDRRFLRDRGADEVFLDRAFATPHSRIWHLDRQAANNAGLLSP